jgi:hypothetical protein
MSEHTPEPGSEHAALLAVLEAAENLLAHETDPDSGLDAQSYIKAWDDLRRTASIARESLEDG